MISTQDHNARRARLVNQGTCPCGESFIKKGNGKYCNDCKVHRMKPAGIVDYKEYIKNK